MEGPGRALGFGEFVARPWASLRALTHSAIRRLSRRAARTSLRGAAATLAANHLIGESALGPRNYGAAQSMFSCCPSQQAVAPPL